MKTGLFPFENSPVRAAVRFPLQIETTLWTDEGGYPAVTEDISSNGALFVADDAPPVGSRVAFTVTMPAGAMGGVEDVLLDCVGHVVRHGRENGKFKVGLIIDEYSLGSEKR